MKKYHIIFFVTLGLFSSCAKKVQVSTNDNIPPKSAISIIQKGRVTTVSSEETASKSAEVLEGDDIAFIASGLDTMGIKSLTVDVTQNGGFDINGQFFTSKKEEAPATDSSGAGIDRVFLSGILRPDSPNNEMIIRAKSEDHANNTSTTPALRIQFIKKAVARISASSTTINRGESTVLRYESDYATIANINGDTLSTLNGSKTVSPTQTTTYVLKAENNLSSDKDTVVIYVTQPPSTPTINSFNASPSTITQGQSSTLSWSTQNASSIRITPSGYTSSQSSGSTTVSPSSTTTYTITATGPGGTMTKTTRVNVNSSQPTQSCDVTGGGFFAFSYLGKSYKNTHVYSMNLSSFALYNRKFITKITNKSNVRVALYTGGTNVIINPNQSTHNYDGLNVARDWVVETEQFIFSPQIEFCYEEN